VHGGTLRLLRSMVSDADLSKPCKGSSVYRQCFMRSRQPQIDRRQLNLLYTAITLEVVTYDNDDAVSMIVSRVVWRGGVELGSVPPGSAITCSCLSCMCMRRSFGPIE